MDNRSGGIVRGRYRKERSWVGKGFFCLKKEGSSGKGKIPHKIRSPSNLHRGEGGLIQKKKKNGEGGRKSPLGIWCYAGRRKRRKMSQNKRGEIYSAKRRFFCGGAGLD